MTTDAFKSFSSSLALARRKLPTADRLVQQLLLAHVVILLEEYLQTLVVALMNHSDKLLLSLAQSKHFENHKLTLANAIKIDPRQYLQALVKEFNFHSLGDTEPLLRQAFNIKINITHELVELIKQRNDVIHRNGFTKDGQPLALTAAAVLEAANRVEALVSSIDEQAARLMAQPGEAVR